MLFVYRDQSSMAGSAWGVVISCLFESSLDSSWEGPTGEELLARFLFFRGNGVFTACEPLHINCSSGEATGGACLVESSTLPTRSASGSLMVAGVDGGGQSTTVGSFGVLLPVPISVRVLFVFGVPIDLDPFPGTLRRFSFSASRSLALATDGTPSMN